MKNFTYARAEDAKRALYLFGQDPARTRYLAGGTNLVDLMRENIESADHLVDVSGLETDITVRTDGSIRIGAGVKNTAAAAHEGLRARVPVLSEAILHGASGQIRNMATVAGNMMQRTRCDYFYDGAASCNKRQPGAGCDALDGFNRYHAILGASESCIATHPSDMCVALAALDATVSIANKADIPFSRLHRLPGDAPDRDTNLEPGDLITAVEIPNLAFMKNSTYRKIRDRSSYAFALISVAAGLDIEHGPGDRPENRRIRDVRLALGGVAHIPWRCLAAEEVLRGAPLTDDIFERAAEAELAPAIGRKDNAFKIELAKRAIAMVLKELCQ